MRRRLLPVHLVRSSALLAVAAVAVALAGCGAEGEKVAEGAPFAKVATKFGEVSIATEPKRVVALGGGTPRRRSRWGGAGGGE